MSLVAPRRVAPEATVERRPVVSPLGSDHRVARRRRMAEPEYAAAAAALRPLEGLARLVIEYRIKNDLTQEQLAQRMETSAPAISRLESGQHRPSVETLEKLGHAFGERIVLGFEDSTGSRELAAVGR